MNRAYLLLRYWNSTQTRWLRFETALSDLEVDRWRSPACFFPSRCLIIADIWHLLKGNWHPCIFLFFFMSSLEDSVLSSPFTYARFTGFFPLFKAQCQLLLVHGYLFIWMPPGGSLRMSEAKAQLVIASARPNAGFFPPLI